MPLLPRPVGSRTSPSGRDPRRPLAALLVLAGLSVSALLGACHDPVSTRSLRAVNAGALRRSSAPFASSCAGIPAFPAQPASSSYGVGVNTLGPIVSYDPVTASTYGSIATLVRESNIGWVRQDFDWGRAIAPGAARVDTGQIDWSRMDVAVNNAVCRGLNVLGNLAYTPAWAAPRLTNVPDSLKWKYLPDNLNDWAAFVRAAVVHYPQIRYWSIWNEPNAANFFLGQSPGRTRDQLIADYNLLIQYAAPQIRGNVDGQGARYLVAPELGGAAAADANYWLNGVLAPQGSNVDVVAVHAYGSRTSIPSYMQGIVGQTTRPVWLTEAGPTGCNTTAPTQRKALSDQGWYYCVGTNQSYIDDQYQASHVSAVLQAMPGHWAKTFYWHSHTEVVGNYDGSDDYGILHGARSNAIVGRPAYTTYAGIAGPLGISGGDYGSNQNVSVTATPAAPASYYYVWEYEWCYNGNAPGDCDHLWHPYASGSMSTISPYVYKQDLWVYVRVTQYAWQNGPQIGATGAWVINGDGTCTDPRGCPYNMYAGVKPGTDTTKIGRGQDPSAERMKGIGHAGNR